MFLKSSKRVQPSSGLYNQQVKCPPPRILVVSFRSGGWGGFAEYVCAPEIALVRKPPRMTFEQAAALPQAGQLAVQGLFAAGPLRSGQKILINGAGGGVGTIAIQLAKSQDVEVTGVDSAAKFEMMRAIGFDYVIDYRNENFARNGQRHDLILDTKTTRSPFAYTRSLSAGESTPQSVETCPDCSSL